MGTPDFSVPALEALLDAEHDICAVYCQRAKPAGRGYHLQPCPVEEAARARGLTVFTPKTLRDPQEQAIFAAHNADIAVVVAYGLILPKEILEAPKGGCLNIHGSLLPRWRGAAPIHRALLAGDTQTGITIMRMDEGLDTGPMLLWETVPITSTTTTSELYETLSQIGARLIVEALAKLEVGALPDHTQPDTGVTYAHKITRQDGELDWRAPASYLERHVRALTPWPGAFFFWNNEMIKVLEVEVCELESGHAPGTLVSKDLIIACGPGGLKIKKLQRPGRAPLDARAFLNGISLGVGEIFPLSEPLQAKECVWDAIN